MGEMLTRIFNTLMLIETKGDNTITMASCLQALQEVIQQASQMESELEDLRKANSEVEE